jgi:hypothetical protein
MLETIDEDVCSAVVAKLVDVETFVGTCEPGIMSNIIVRLDRASKWKLRAASNALRTVMNSCVTTVAVKFKEGQVPRLGMCEDGQVRVLAHPFPTSELADIFPNADCLHLEAQERGPLMFEQLAATSSTFFARLRKLRVVAKYTQYACSVLLPRYGLPMPAEQQGPRLLGTGRLSKDVRPSMHHLTSSWQQGLQSYRLHTALRRPCRYQPKAYGQNQPTRSCHADEGRH